MPTADESKSAGLSGPGVRPQTVRELYAEIATAVVMLALWGVIWNLTSDFPEGAARFPRFVLMGLFVFSGLQLVIAASRLVAIVRARRAESETDEPSSSRDVQADGDSPARDSASKWRFASIESGTTRMIILFGGAVLYVIAIPIVGYAVSTFTFLGAAIMAVLGWNPKRLIWVLLIVVLLDVVIGGLAGIRLPRGFLY